jgi:hypothetical protein
LLVEGIEQEEKKQLREQYMKPSPWRELGRTRPVEKGDHILALQREKKVRKEGEELPDSFLGGTGS